MMLYLIFHVPNFNIRVLDPPTHSRQFDANSGKIRYMSDPKANRSSFCQTFLMHWMVCSLEGLYYLGCMVVNINVLFCWMRHYWMWLHSDIVAWDSFHHGTQYLFADIDARRDAVITTFQVLVKTYFFNISYALLWFCLLIALRALFHLI